MKKYIYEFVFFAVFYLISGLLFGFDSNLICLTVGVVGPFIGKFISKINGFLLDKITDHNIVKEKDGMIDVRFTIKADYKRSPLILYGSYNSKEIIDDNLLAVFIYREFNDSKYKQVLSFGITKLYFQSNNEAIEIEIKN